MKEFFLSPWTWLGFIIVFIAIIYYPFFYRSKNKKVSNEIEKPVEDGLYIPGDEHFVSTESIRVLIKSLVKECESAPFPLEKLKQYNEVIKPYVVDRVVKFIFRDLSNRTAMMIYHELIEIDLNPIGMNIESDIQKSIQETSMKHQNILEKGFVEIL